MVERHPVLLEKVQVAAAAQPVCPKRSENQKNEKTFICQEESCGMGFTRKHDLKRHVAARHEPEAITRFFQENV